VGETLLRPKAERQAKTCAEKRPHAKVAKGAKMDGRSLGFFAPLATLA
jgi:hypothetical protein